MAKERTFQTRLQDVMVTGQLTVADLSHWFERNYHTVRQWALEGIVPRQHKLFSFEQSNAAYANLALLEYAVSEGAFKPLQKLSPRSRPAEVKKLHAYWHRYRRSVPSRRVARNRVQGGSSL
jgi:hypothetical protein